MCAEVVDGNRRLVGSRRLVALVITVNGPHSASLSLGLWSLVCVPRFDLYGDSQDFQICKERVWDTKVQGTSCFRGQVYFLLVTDPFHKKDANVQARDQLKNSCPSPNLTPASRICPPRSPEAIRAVSGAHRRGLEYRVLLFTRDIARPDARVLTGEGRGESRFRTPLEVRAPGRRCRARVRCPTGQNAALLQSLPRWPEPRVAAAGEAEGP